MPQVRNVALNFTEVNKDEFAFIPIEETLKVVLGSRLSFACTFNSFDLETQPGFFPRIIFVLICVLLKMKLFTLAYM